MYDDNGWHQIRNRKEKYQAYLCSRDWGLLREAVHDRADGICERCKLNRGHAVHHLTYVRIYQEKLEDLRLLCEDCHEFVHGRGDVDPARIDLSVYMAGSVFESGDDRHCFDLVKREICEEDGSEQLTGDALNDWRSEIFVGIDDTQKSGTAESAPVVKMGNLFFSYAGPTISYQHGVHGDLELPQQCLDEVSQADVLFAWVDSRSTIGTLVEIGAAYAMGKPVYVAFKNEKLRNLFYFAGRLSCKFYEDDHGGGVVGLSVIEAFRLMSVQIMKVRN